MKNLNSNPHEVESIKMKSCANKYLKTIKQTQVTNPNNETTMQPKYDGISSGMFSIIGGDHFKMRQV
jgi:hypothetical protein